MLLDWLLRSEVIARLTAYTSTPQGPHFLFDVWTGDQSQTARIEARKCKREIVCSNKFKGRVYANENRGAVSKSIDVEGEVLLGADKSNRLSKLPKDRMRGHSEE